MRNDAFWKITGVAAGVLALSLSGCDDKKAAPTAATAQPGATATAKATAAKTAEPAKKAGYTQGDVLKHMPADCESGRVYARMGDLYGMKGVAGELNTLQDTMVASLGPESKAKEILAVLKDGGFDPVKTIADTAMCMGKDEEPVVAAGLNLGKIEDPLELVAKAIEKSGKPKPKIETEGEMRWMGTGEAEGVIAMVSPNVIAVAKNKEALLPLAKGGGAKGFGDAAKSLIWASIKTGKESAVDAKLMDKGDDLDVWAAIGMDGPGLDEMKKNPDAFVKQMEQEAAKIADELAKTPFKMLAERVKAAKFAVEGDKAVITASVPKTDLVAALKAAASAKPEELMGMMR
ncbi:MAG: hypothetical protein JRI23_24470 [Deltaproteobacteria bacterium]|jgi:hypothetical protein|nr:hypothetical protein [Deltaproteobacteria bacterium]MBW2535161.1 hypothetical protein [Deltaproteobacteria bacterium]